MNNLQKITAPIIAREFNSFAMIGDPGCDGLGIASMQVFASALTCASSSDLILVTGDLVPHGDQRNYQRASAIISRVAQQDVYMLRGNHDGGAYHDFFGLSEFALVNDKIALIVLDNANRQFTESGLKLLNEILTTTKCHNIVIAFHIPLPNNFTTNTVSATEFEKLRAVYLPHQSRIKYLVCGHVHSRFVDEIGGIKLVCSGGGGAMIEDVSDKISAAEIDHHLVHFTLNADGELVHQFIDLSDQFYEVELLDGTLSEQLHNAVKGELFAHLRYLSFAEDSERRGLHQQANLFYALAESEYRHARSFFSLLEKPVHFRETAATFIPREKFEYEHLYQAMQNYSEQHGAPLTNRAFADAADAEKIHAQLLTECAAENFAVTELYVCQSCGFVKRHHHANSNERCPVCGAPNNRFTKFVAND